MPGGVFEMFLSPSAFDLAVCQGLLCAECGVFDEQRIGHFCSPSCYLQSLDREQRRRENERALLSAYGSWEAFWQHVVDEPPFGGVE